MTSLTIGEEVRAGLAGGQAAVALETSVIGQGLPFPRNRECVERMSAAVRTGGAVPAWIGVIEGSVTVGLSDAEVARFTEPGAASKVARRDYPIAVAAGGLGATTVSATIWAAARARIEVAATGGVGGVHRGGGGLDVSADLFELSRTPGLLVCSGPKSVIDPVATAEKLEALGVALVGYGVDRLPFFLATASSVELEHRTDTPEGAAAMLRAAVSLDTRSTILLCNPVPEGAAMDAEEVAAAAAEAEIRADRAGILGKARTPFLLAALAELTDGRSLTANLALLEANALLAGRIASAARS